MIHFERPPAPPDFEDRARAPRQAVRDAVAAGEEPRFEDELWGDHKDAFALAQEGKCAYCEMSVANQDSTIDHFAPKAEVYELNPMEAKRGREKWSRLPNMEGRKPGRKVKPGYWWRAYEWDNFLLACTACNSKWKACYFPVAADPRRWPPEEDVDEPLLMLNPYDDQNPWRSFVFDEAGQMVAAPGDERGRATIETLGFERRESVRLHREAAARSAHNHARTFMRYFSADRRDLAARELDALCELGGVERDHAGMVRAIAEAILEMSWDELQRLRQIGLSTKNRRP